RASRFAPAPRPCSRAWALSASPTASPRPPRPETSPQVRSRPMFVSVGGPVASILDRWGRGLVADDRPAWFPQNQIRNRFMSSTGKVLAFVGIASFAASVASAQSLPPSVVACASEKDSLARLVCFDREVAKYSQAAPAVAQKPAAPATQ